MQRAGAAVLLAVLLAVLSPVAAERLVSAPAKVVELLQELEAHIKADGEHEQKTYDKYACWCENTLSRKAKDISSAKDTVETLQRAVTKLKGDLGAHGAEIQQLKKDISANLDSQKSAADMRDREYEAFEAEKNEAEQAIGALEAAIRVLSSSGSGKKGFLETMQEAQVLSVVAGVRGVLRDPRVSQAVSDQDLGLVRRFVERPEDFLGGHTAGLSAAQIANNPFGDYAPQSSQIQGILKGMYDAFTANLEKANAEEAERQKAFEELTVTKKAELVTLQETLQRQTMDEAEKTKLVADNKKVLDDTRAQITADEKFFSEAKSSCKAKAGEWAQRTRIRTEELQGITSALAILTGPEAQRVFGGAEAPTLLQLASASGRRQHRCREEASSRLRELARLYRSVALAKLSSELRTGGHFDRVISSIDQMIEVLRAEEQSDIEHRSRCQASVTTNNHNIEDLKVAVEKSEKALERMRDDAEQLRSKLTALDGDSAATKADIEALHELRAKEHDDYLKAQKDGADAVQLLNEAITVLSAFFKEKHIPMSLLSAGRGHNPEEQAPETWSAADDFSHKGEKRGIIAMLSMIKEDIEKDIIAGRKDEESAQQMFVKDRQGLQNTLNAQANAKLATEGELADLERKMADQEKHKERQAGDLVGEEATQAALAKDCAWVESHFQDRRDNRKKEIDGLTDAKAYLAGMNSASD